MGNFSKCATPRLTDLQCNEGSLAVWSTWSTEAAKCDLTAGGTLLSSNSGYCSCQPS